jgi:hypothetical protein
MLSVMTCILSKERQNLPCSPRQKFPGAKVALQSEELKIHCRRRFFDLGAVIRTADQSEFRFVGSPQYNEPFSARRRLRNPGTTVASIRPLSTAWLRTVASPNTII